MQIVFLWHRWRLSVIRLVELTLTPSSKIHQELLLLLLTDPFTGAILKMGIVERAILDYTVTPYDQIISGEPYPRTEYCYSNTFIIHDDYLVFMCRDYSQVGTEIDKYKVRINWIDDDLNIGAYKNSIVHSKANKGVEGAFITGIPNLYGYFKTERYNQSYLLEDINNNIVTYNLPSDYYSDSYFNAVITDTGTQLAVFAFKSSGDGIVLDNTKLNSYDLKDGEQLEFTGQQIYEGAIPFESSDRLGTIDPANEWAIKQATSGFIATVKSTEFIRGLVVPINERSCYVLWNGRNPTAWDREIYFIEENIKTRLTKPDLASLYPELGIISYRIAHSSYEVYFDTTKGFWRDFVYSEEIIGD